MNERIEGARLLLGSEAALGKWLQTGRNTQSVQPQKSLMTFFIELENSVHRDAEDSRCPEQF